jgi:hypothetical protein
MISCATGTKAPPAVTAYFALAVDIIPAHLSASIKCAAENQLVIKLTLKTRRYIFTSSIMRYIAYSQEFD